MFHGKGFLVLGFGFHGKDLVLDLGGGSNVGVKRVRR